MVSLIRNDPGLLLVMLPAILIALTFHEFAHGYVAYKCGDPTAKYMGRLTLNPLRHLDLYGTIMMFFVGFGWAKPVPINMRNFKKSKRDLFLVSIAGIAFNILLAFIGSVLFFVAAMLFLKSSGGEYASLTIKEYLSMFSFSGPIFIFDQRSLFDILPAVQQMTLQFLSVFVMINTGLAVFNLIPIPPLDGSKILSVVLSPIAAAKYLRIEYYSRYIFLGLIFISYTMPALDYYIWLPVSLARNGIMYLFQQFMLLLL